MVEGLQEKELVEQERASCFAGRRASDSKKRKNKSESGDCRPKWRFGVSDHSGTTSRGHSRSNKTLWSDERKFTLFRFFCCRFTHSIGSFVKRTRSPFLFIIGSSEFDLLGDASNILFSSPRPLRITGTSTALTLCIG